MKKIIIGENGIKSFDDVQKLIVKCPVWEEKKLERLLKKGLPLIEGTQDGMLIIEKAKRDSEIRIEAIYRTLSKTISATEYDDTIMAISYMVN